MNDLDKFIKMANIIPSNPQSFNKSLKEVISFIEIIKTLDIDCSLPMYEKSWIKLKFREDIPTDTKDSLEFIKKRMCDSFFVVDRVVK